MKMPTRAFLSDSNEPGLGNFSNHILEQLFRKYYRVHICKYSEIKAYNNNNNNNYVLNFLELE